MSRRQFNPRNIQWRSSLRANMENDSEQQNSDADEFHSPENTDMDCVIEESESKTGVQTQHRTFYNGEETFSSLSFNEGASNFSEFQSLSSQKSKGHRNTKKHLQVARNYRGFHGGFRRPRRNFKYTAVDYQSNSKNNLSGLNFQSSCPSVKDKEPVSLNSNENLEQKSNEYEIEYFPKTVNVNKMRGQTSAGEGEESFSQNLADLDLTSIDPKTKFLLFRQAKEKFDSLMNVMSPSEIVMDYRQQIDKMSNDCIKQNLNKMEKIKSMMVDEDYANIFKLHYANLELQQNNFDTYVNSMKVKCSSIISDSNPDDIIKKADNIKMHIENECNLFQRTLPSYGYKSDILGTLKKYQVIIISADPSYFFNTVTPLILISELSDYFVMSCETSDMACEWVRIDFKNIIKHSIVNSSNFECLNENEMLKYLKNNEISAKHCFILNLPLKRSVTSDLLIASFSDILQKQKDSKLILLLSTFDSSEKYQKYFSALKVFLLEVPRLLLPVQTVWKKEPLSIKNYKEEIVTTALSIHILNEPGDVLVFLPCSADAKAALSMMIKKIQELNSSNVVCILFHESSSNILQFKQQLNSKKRRIFFATHSAEAFPIQSVRYVIDCGLTRGYIFDNDKNLDVLTTIFSSRARARLRRSLVGVYASGICYRIYNKENFCTEMSSFELPDILTLNPFNTLITVFHNLPKKALSVSFVEPLSDTVKYNTVKLLKNFSAIKDGKLTQLGVKMVQLPFTARYSKLILQSIHWGFAYEAVILVAYFSIDSNLFTFTKDEEYQRKIDASKLELMQHESDALSFLYIFKSWMENGCGSMWCDKYHIEYNTLNEVRIKVDEICRTVYECLNESIIQEFSDVEDSSTTILELLFQCFFDNLSVYSGHYRCGYRILSSRQTAFIHPSSILCEKNFPQHIIFDKIVSTSRNFLVGITSIPSDIILKYLEENTLECDYSDIFERTLVSQTIEPVGERIIKQVLLGKKAKKLLEIEELIKKELKSEYIVIDPCAEKGCVNVYALEHVLEAAVKMVDEILKSNLEDVINAEQSYSLELKKGETSIPLEVKCVMGAKITSVKVKEKNVPHSVKNSNMVTVKPVKDTMSSVQYSINLTWIRRACNGICYVSFTPETFVLARKLAMRVITILQTEVFVQVSNRTSTNAELFLTDVPREARRSDIEEAMKKWIPDAVIQNVELKFEKTFATTSKDIEDIKMEIQENCEVVANLLEFDIIIPKPKDTATLMTAYINVYGSEDLTAAAEHLSNTMINNFKVTAIPVYRSIIRINYQMYKALEVRIAEGIEKLKSDLSKVFPEKDLFRFEAQHIDDSNMVQLKLLSNDMKIMKYLQKTVNELLEGEVLNKNNVSDIHKLFCHGGHMWLRTLEKSKKVYILEEYNSKTIRVYGSRESCFKVKESILHFLEDTETEAVETIILSNDKNKRVLIKALIKEYGVNLEPFVEYCALRSAILDIKSCSLSLHGSRESIDKAKEVIDQLSSNLDSTEEYSLLSGGEMCPVCASPPFNLTVRLQHCNHLYCNECISGLVEQAQFPIQCCAENCSEDIVLDDIIRILDEDDAKIKRLLHASLDDFLERNRSEIFYCPAPDCPMFAYKSEVSGRWMCKLCQNEICINCNVVYHYGFTCDVYQGSKKDPDYSFKVWKKGAADCKECPRCKTAIEKNAGCDHMTCGSCKAHFCWVCCREFPSDRAVYNHIPFCDQYPQW